MPGILCASVQFLSTLSLRRATRKRHYNGLSKKISIHALLAESDAATTAAVAEISNHFYPRSPCGERLSNFILGGAAAKFLSTLSLRRATLVAALGGHGHPYFYPRSPCGERRNAAKQAESSAVYFYPRSPCGERPNLLVGSCVCLGISIHALLAESDFVAQSVQVLAKLFLSTLSLRRATLSWDSAKKIWRNFYPRSPCGERPIPFVQFLLHTPISIHALLAESDCEKSHCKIRFRSISIHALLAESDGSGTRDTMP